MGKMAIPDDILQKPGPLNELEWEKMRQHPQYAYEMLSPITYLRPALIIPFYHHERWDGSGYPRKLKGEEIPLEARLFSIVDVWDALRSDRPYRKKLPQDEVKKYLKERAGYLFDPRLVEVFLTVVETEA
jgi:HD-GYP domain-containing protein (c-di-GMP phosphodiesterase class II)